MKTDLVLAVSLSFHFVIIFRVACGAGFSVFGSDNGIVMTCGDGSTGCLGHGDYHSASRPRLIETLLRLDITTWSYIKDKDIMLLDHLK